jgi:hypothetical protein
LLADRDEMSNVYRGPSIDASYQVSDHLAKRFQRRRFLEINRSETRIACGGMFVNGSNSCLNIDICIQNAVISIQIFLNFHL